MNILILTNAPVPYRMEFFEEIGKHTQLTVLFEQTAAEQTHRNPHWFSKGNESFKAVYLEGIKLGAKRLQTEVCKYLSDANFNTVLIMGYSLPTEMLAILYLHLKKRPFILCFDGIAPKHTSYFKRAIKRFFIQKATAYLSTGTLTDQYIVDMGGNSENIFRVPFTTMHVDEIPQVVPSQVTKEHYKTKLGIVGKRIVLSVGQFIHRKGFDILIEAASKLREDHEFYLIGDEPTDEYLALKQQVGAENVHFIGFKNKEELPEYYLASDYFVLPTREDVWALVIPEAMAFGLPTITTDHCGAGLELIKPRFPGCIVPIDNPEAIINAISLLDSDPMLRNSISIDNHIHMKEYTLESMVDCYMQIFQKVREKSNA